MGSRGGQATDWASRLLASGTSPLLPRKGCLCQLGKRFLDAFPRSLLPTISPQNSIWGSCWLQDNWVPQWSLFCGSNDWLIQEGSGCDLSQANQSVSQLFAGIAGSKTVLSSCWALQRKYVLEPHELRGLKAPQTSQSLVETLWCYTKQRTRKKSDPERSFESVKQVSP